MSVDLADPDFWIRLGFDPDEMTDNNLESWRISILKYPTGPLKQFCQNYIQGNVPSKKNDIASLLSMNEHLHPIAKELHILEKFYREVSKKAILQINSVSGFEPETKNLREILLYLYIHNKQLLTACRNLSISEKRRTYTNYKLPGPVLPQFEDIVTLDERIESELPTLNWERLIRLEATQIVSDNLLLVFKTESKEKRVEQFYDSHYDKPAKWVIFEVNYDTKLVSVKGIVTELAVLLLNKISFVLTGTMDHPVVDHSNIPEDKPLVSEPNQEQIETIENEANLEFLNHERITISLENSPLPGNPTLTLDGQVSIDDALLELEHEYGLSFNHGQQVMRKYRIIYKKEGVSNTILVTQYRDRSPLFSKSIPWKDRIAILKYLDQIN